MAVKRGKDGKLKKGSVLNPQGRPQGSRDIADEWLRAYEKLGGMEALVEWAQDNPTEFYKCAAKLFPKDIKVEATVGLNWEGLVKLWNTGREKPAE